MKNEMAWIFLLLAGLTEVGWAVSLKSTAGFTRLWPSFFTVLGMVLSFAFLSQSLKLIPVGTAYAVWTGIGAAGTALLGILIFHEPAGFFRIFCLMLIVLGATGLKFGS